MGDKYSSWDMERKINKNWQKIDRQYWIISKLISNYQDSTDTVQLDLMKFIG